MDHSSNLVNCLRGRAGSVEVNTDSLSLLGVDPLEGTKYLVIKQLKCDVELQLCPHEPFCQ